MSLINDPTFVTYDNKFSRFNKSRPERFSFRFGTPSFIEHLGQTGGLGAPPVDVAAVGADGAYLVGNGTASNRDRIFTPHYFKHAVGGNPWTCQARFKYDKAADVNGNAFVGMISAGVTQDFNSTVAASLIGVKIEGEPSSPTFTVIGANFASLTPATLVTLGTFSPTGSFPRYLQAGVNFDGKKTTVFFEDESLEFDLGNPSLGTAGMLAFQVNNNMNLPTGKILVREMELGYDSVLA